MTPPDLQALQVFYGSIPVILVIVGAILRMHADAKTQIVLLQDIAARLGRIETKLDNHEQRISALEGARWK
jgi:hypothetical protein